MRRILSSLATLALIAQPLSAFAVYETPGALLQAVRFDSSAKTFKAEVHGNSGTTYMSAWMNGAMQGVNVADAKVSAQMTIDMEDTVHHMKGRVKGSVMVLHGRFYAKLDSMEGTFEDDVMLGSIRFLTKKWIAFPAEEEMIDAIQEIINQTGDPSEADDLYTMTRVPYAYGNSYVLTVKNGADVPFPSMEIKIDTDYKDKVQVSQITIAGTADAFDRNSQFKGSIKTERMRTPFTLSAPADTISFDALMNHMSDIDPSDIFPAAENPFDLEGDDWGDDEDDELPSDDAFETIPDVDFDEEPLRPTRPSRRAIQQGQSVQNDNKPYGRPVPKQQVSVLGNRGLTLGSQSAPITIVQFTDMQCPFCLRHAMETMPDIIKEYIETGHVRYVLRHYPLSFHEYAYSSALAVECSALQSKDLGWKMVNGLNQAQNDDQSLDDKLIWSVAGSIKGLDQKAFTKCMDTKDTADEVAADMAAASKAGVEGTPAFFILSDGGATVDTIFGAYPIETFREMLDELLED